MDVFNEARSAKSATNNSVAVLLIFIWLWLKPGPLTQQKRRWPAVRWRRRSLYRSPLCACVLASGYRGHLQLGADPSPSSGLVLVDDIISQACCRRPCLLLIQPSRLHTLSAHVWNVALLKHTSVTFVWQTDITTITSKPRPQHAQKVTVFGWEGAVLRYQLMLADMAATRLGHRRLLISPAHSDLWTCGQWGFHPAAVWCH